MVACRRRAELLAHVGEVEGRSLWQDARRRLFRNKAAVVSIVVLALIVLAACFAPWLSPHPFDEVYWDQIGMPPDYANAHWFGTDDNGRDLFVRCSTAPASRWRSAFAATLVEPRDRRRLRRRRRLPRRQGRRGDDAHRRHPLLAALHVLRDHPDGRLRPQHHPAVRGPRRRRVADHGADRARPDAVGEAQGVHRGGARRRRLQLAHRAPPHHPQRARAGGRLRHADRARGDHDRELPLVPRPGRAGALHLLGRADLGGRRADGERALDADLSRRCSWP